MTNRTELERTIRELREMELMQKELEAEIEALKDTLKAALNEAHTEEMIVGTSIVRFTTVTTNRFDSTSFKKSYAELYKAFTKQTTSRRFSIS